MTFFPPCKSPSPPPPCLWPGLCDCFPSLRLPVPRDSLIADFWWSRRSLLFLMTFRLAFCGTRFFFFLSPSYRPSPSFRGRPFPGAPRGLPHGERFLVRLRLSLHSPKLWFLATFRTRPGSGFFILPSSDGACGNQAPSLTSRVTPGFAFFPTSTTSHCVFFLRATVLLFPRGNS